MQDIDVAAFLHVGDEIGGTLPKETAPLLASMHAEVSLSHVSKQVVEGKEVDLIALTDILVKAKLAVAPVATDHNFKTMVRSVTDKWQKMGREYEVYLRPDIAKKFASDNFWLVVKAMDDWSFTGEAAFLVSDEQNPEFTRTTKQVENFVVATRAVGRIIDDLAPLVPSISWLEEEELTAVRKLVGGMERLRVVADDAGYVLASMFLCKKIYKGGMNMDLINYITRVLWVDISSFNLAMQKRIEEALPRKFRRVTRPTQTPVKSTPVDAAAAQSDAKMPPKRKFRKLKASSRQISMGQEGR